MGWREEIRDGTTTTLQAFAAANSSIVDRVYRSRPGSIVEGRSLYTGGISETIALDSGTFGRDATVEVVAAARFADNEETVDRLDALADAAIEWIAANARAHALGAHTLIEPVRSQSVELDEGGIIVPAVVITCRARILQGRS